VWDWEGRCYATPEIHGHSRHEGHELRQIHAGRCPAEGIKGRLDALAGGCQCEPTEGGYQIRGRWPWASNCENSDWYFVSAMLPPDGGAAPQVGWFLTPASTLSVDQSSWHVSWYWLWRLRWERRVRRRRRAGR